MNNNKSAISIQDPNRPPSTKPYLSNGYSHSKNGSMTNLHSAQDDVSDDGMPVGRATTAADHPGGIGAPATPRSASARPAEDRARSTDPAWDGLDLGGMHLKALSQSLFSFAHITALYINYNNLTSLPPAISELRKLKTLDVTGNQLTAVPAELGMLVTLKELFLFDNQLSSLPPELGTLHNLDVIGIAGNPLPDNLKLTLERDGTAALISYLRDSCPVPLPPPDREWITIEADNLSLEAPREQETFTLLCYNILAERAATSQMYGYTPSWALAWDYRKELILQEIMGCGSDFICLQEVEDERFHDTFLQNLKSEGYEGAFFPKTRSRTMSTDEKRRVDGCATFWKASKWVRFLAFQTSRVR
jgi:CCR4-NOT transcription complex subunit 6